MGTTLRRFKIFSGIKFALLSVRSCSCWQFHISPTLESLAPIGIQNYLKTIKRLRARSEHLTSTAHMNSTLFSRWGTVPTATIGFGIFRGSPIADLRCTQISIMTRHDFKEN
jgi:hypothetical protein